VHAPQFDHLDAHRTRYAAIMMIPGVDVPLELRWAPAAAALMHGYDPVSLAVRGVADLEAWAAHLDESGIDHSPISSGAAGHLLVFADPDGTFLRLLELPAGGIEATTVGSGDPEPDGPWIAPPVMAHPASTDRGAR
jgi:hypothetical protein